MADAARLLELRTTLDDYVAAGGGAALEEALSMSPDDVIDAVTRSGLRGRGGAGFPTGRTWATVRRDGVGPRYVICNGAEGEPATFKDRMLMRRNPYLILEGVAIAAYAVGAPVAYVGVKDSFRAESQRMAAAIDDMEAAGLLGDLQVELVLGPDRYLFGEETGLLGVIEGRGPFPRVVRPFMKGLFAGSATDNPTLENNAETLGNVPRIIRYGPDAFRSQGTDTSPGSMLFTICGDVEREGVFELPLGTPMRHLVEDLAGAEDVKVVIPGASGAAITSLDVPMDFDSMRRAGTSLGAAGFCVFDSTACVVDIARAYARFLYVESCGQCPSCKNGGGAIWSNLDALARGTGGAGAVDDVLRWAGEVTDGQKCALPNGQELIVLSLIRSFTEEFEDHAECPRRARLPKITDFDEAAGRFSYDERDDDDPQWGIS